MGTVNFDPKNPQTAMQRQALNAGNEFRQFFEDEKKKGLWKPHPNADKLIALAKRLRP